MLAHDMTDRPPLTGLMLIYSCSNQTNNTQTHYAHSHTQAHKHTSTHTCAQHGLVCVEGYFLSPDQPLSARCPSSLSSPLVNGYQAHPIIIISVVIFRPCHTIIVPCHPCLLTSYLVQRHIAPLIYKSPCSPPFPGKSSPQPTTHLFWAPLVPRLSSLHSNTPHISRELLPLSYRLPFFSFLPLPPWCGMGESIQPPPSPLSLRMRCVQLTTTFFVPFFSHLL
ncbi:MAG: hypothetical protein BYD32DRAFT_160411 [Podila humilis]|nr:MAG: hypothetical protein BYD32DRAFT_160411 [Podila humilis]